MKKIALILLIALVLVIGLVIGCTQTKNKDSTNQKSLSELQVSACNSADAAKTCDTRLAEVGIVLKEDCCKEMGKCC